MQLIAYLAFDGTCREAFDFYRGVFDGEIVARFTYGESPMAAEIPADGHDRIMHTHLQARGAELMGADGPPGSGPGRTCVNVMADSVEDAERIWSRLADGANVSMPLAETFWAERFGMLVDRFGTPWMVNRVRPCETP
ncbi:VOC family protein [Lysobacter humi (ex Lee et al. 2017)]